MSKEISRRDFLKSAAAGAVGIAATSMLGGCTTNTATPPVADTQPLESPMPQEPEKPELTPGSMPVTQELPVPDVPAPAITEYETDILVIGSGYAGAAAAITAKKAGKTVLLMDKGQPGYTGLSPWPQCYQFFESKYGDDPVMQTEIAMHAGEYIANLDWYKIYLEESHDCFNEYVEWGIYTQYPNASEDPADFYASGQDWEYHKAYEQYDRRIKWNQNLINQGVEYITHTMLMDVIEQDGRIVGAVGMHIGGTLITVRAKAVIMCMGIGSYRNSGYPMSGSTFDHEWIAYHHGIPVTGKEWDHLEATNSVTPSSCWRNYSWGYLENMHATAGHSIMATGNGERNTVESVTKARVGSILSRITACQEGIEQRAWEDTSAQGLGNAFFSTDPDNDPRMTGNDVDAMPRRDIIGASVGMGIFKNNGVFCGIDDLVGYTGLPGLYVAGDALASMIYGATYSPGQGGSISVSHIQGRRAAKAAAEYVDGVNFVNIDSANLNNIKEQIFAPMNREKGINPRWARDVLQGIMAPWWIQIVKTEESLKSALVQVELLREGVVPKLVAWNAHDLRLCHEVAHKVLSAEMKLRASLERRESRGSVYRSDYPYRDDKNFLCYITLKKGKNGDMITERVPVKDEWKGDTSMSYAERYIVRFPGEAKALGLPEQS